MFAPPGDFLPKPRRDSSKRMARVYEQDPRSMSLTALPTVPPNLPVSEESNRGYLPSHRPSEVLLPFPPSFHRYELAIRNLVYILFCISLTFTLTVRVYPRRVQIHPLSIRLSHQMPMSRPHLLRASTSQVQMIHRCQNALAHTLQYRACVLILEKRLLLEPSVGQQQPLICQQHLIYLIRLFHTWPTRHQ